MLKIILFTITLSLFSITCVIATNPSTNPNEPLAELATVDSTKTSTAVGGEFYFPNHTEEMTRASEAQQPEFFPCSCYSLFGGGQTVMCADTDDCVCRSQVFSCNCLCYTHCHPNDAPY